MKEFGSLITAMITPFELGDKSKIDFAAVERIVTHLVSTGSDSIVVAGTTGESPTLTHDEEIELLRVTQAQIKKLGSQTQVIFGAGSNSTNTAIEMSRRAEKESVDGLLIVVPYYNKPKQKGLKEHYSLIAKNTNTPIILYNVPGRTVVSLEAETIISLHQEYKHICSLKEASNNLDIISAVYQKLNPDEFSIYCGDDSLTLPMLAVGACGVISVASHLVGSQMQSMIALYKSGKHQEALTIHRKLFPLFCELFTEPNPTCVKEAVAMLGLASAELREPLVPLSEEQRNKLKSLIA